jgi:N-acetylneuraminate synthase
MLREQIAAARCSVDPAVAGGNGDRTWIAFLCRVGGWPHTQPAGAFATSVCYIAEVRAARAGSTAGTASAPCGSGQEGFVTSARLLQEGRCLIIAEVAQAHDGSLGTAHAFVDAVARTGADAIKFQTHYADAESSPLEPFRIKFSPQDETRYDYWKRLEFTEEQWRELARHAQERGLIFLSSAFSMRAVEVLDRLGMRAWKVASGEIVNAPMLDRMAATGRPILLSSGMSGMEEIRWALNRVRSRVAEVAVLQCTTSYPCPPDKVGLNLLQVFRDEFACPVGLSDHSGTIYPGLAGVTLGMEVLELHVTFSRDMYGPDVKASVTFEELKALVDGIRFIETMLANPLDKDASSQGAEPLRQMFMKGLIAVTDIAPGETLDAGKLDARKPLAGIPVARFDEIKGRRARRAIAAGSFIQEDDVA